MRTEKEMIDLIIQCAERDPRARAVMMNGSRVNPHAKKDMFQDYDVVYFVTEVEPYIDNDAFVGQFGDMLIMQTPEAMTDPPPENIGRYVYLMLFTDGNRIDLGLSPVDMINTVMDDSLTVVLLDKDHRIEALPPPSDVDYLPEEPTAKLFDDCCNEFWWVSPYVAKGLWREELTYVKSAMESFIRPQLLKMLTWYFGIKTGFRIAAGKSGKNIKGHIEEALWTEFEHTYADSNFDNIWDSLFLMGDLFRRLAEDVARFYHYDYPYRDDRNVTGYLKHIRQLPGDAREIY